MIEPPEYDENGEKICQTEAATEDERDAEEDEGFEDLEDQTVSLDTAFFPDVIPAQTQAPKATDPGEKQTPSIAPNEDPRIPCEAGNTLLDNFTVFKLTP